MQLVHNILHSATSKLEAFWKDIKESYVLVCKSRVLKSWTLKIGVKKLEEFVFHAMWSEYDKS